MYTSTYIQQYKRSYSIKFISKRDFDVENAQI